MKKIRRLFEKINIYGLDFHLLYKKEANYSTLFDIFLSLIFIFIFLFLSYSYLKNVFISSEFTIVTNSIQLKGKTAIDLSNTSIMFGIANYTGKNINFDKEYINFNLYKTNHEFSVINKRMNRTKINITLEKCTKENMVGYFYDNIKGSFNISNFLCIKKGQNLTIAGQYGDIFNWFDILEFHISKCENKTGLSICKSNEEIDNLLDNTYVNIIYLSYFVDHFNKTHPINYGIESNLFMLSLNSVKRYFYYFAPTKYKSENGLIFNNEKTYNFFEYKKTILDYIDNEKHFDFSSKTLIEIFFTVDPQEINYSRKYIKLHEAIGDIGGCIDIIFNIFNVISSYFSEKSFLIEISNNFINKNKISNFIKNIKKNGNKLNIGNTLKEQNSFTKNMINNNSMKISLENSINNMDIINNKKNLQNNFINNNVINYNNLKISSISNLTSQIQNKKLIYSIIDYCIPFYFMKKMKHKELIYCYEDILKKYMSIEVMIPILERANNNFFGIGNKNSFYFKTNSFLGIN